MKPKIYLETTIPSYLTAWTSRDLVRAAHQQITREWWQTRKAAFELFISQVVLDEAQVGDPDAATRRLASLKGLSLLDATDTVILLAETFLQNIPLPEKAAVDAVHISLAVVHGMDYLLSWNCKHIANAVVRNKVEQISRKQGYEPPTICTPEELLEAYP